MFEECNMHIFQKLHRFSLIIGVFSILLPLVFWSKIPDELPMHYNAAGEVDNWSDKGSLILLFFVIALVMGVMSIAVYLVKTNMESKYSKDAEKSEMRVAYPIVILMNLVVQIMFAYIMFCCITCRHLGTLFLPIFLIATFAPLAYLIYKCGRIQATSGSQKAMYRMVEKTEQGVVYRTAVDWWLGLLLGSCQVLMIWIAVEPILKTGKIAWGTLLMTIGFSIIIVPLFGIRYVLYSEHLLVSMSIYGKARVRYADIVDVKKTMNPLSSAAMSLRRIQIDYVEDGVHRMILISPIKRKTFIKEIEERRERSKS